MSGVAWPTGTPGDFPVGPQKVAACGHHDKYIAVILRSKLINNL